MALEERPWSGTEVTLVTENSLFQSMDMNHILLQLHGVPQGSLLGPLLFIIYVNDIQNSSSILSFILFADDSNLVYTHRDPAQLVSTLNTELINVANWIKANKLSLNLQKTNYMLFSNSITQLPNQVIFSETVIKEVKSTKFLGITIYNKLSWKYHIDNVCKTVSRNIGIINRVKQFLPLSVLLTLYQLLFYHTLIMVY